MKTLFFPRAVLIPEQRCFTGDSINFSAIHSVLHTASIFTNCSADALSPELLIWAKQNLSSGGPWLQRFKGQHKVHCPLAASQTAHGSAAGASWGCFCNAYTKELLALLKNKGRSSHCTKSSHLGPACVSSQGPRGNWQAAHRCWRWCHRPAEQRPQGQRCWQRSVATRYFLVSGRNKSKVNRNEASQGVSHFMKYLE